MQERNQESLWVKCYLESSFSLCQNDDWSSRSFFDLLFNYSVEYHFAEVFR
jgi:hypothetical protein